MNGIHRADKERTLFIIGILGKSFVLPLKKKQPHEIIIKLSL